MTALLRLFSRMILLEESQALTNELRLKTNGGGLIWKVLFFPLSPLLLRLPL